MSHTLLTGSLCFVGTKYLEILKIITVNYDYFATDGQRPVCSMN